MVGEGALKPQDLCDILHFCNSTSTHMEAGEIGVLKNDDFLEVMGKLKFLEMLRKRQFLDKIRKMLFLEVIRILEFLKIMEKYLLN